jgi:hypothetical protein
MRLAELQTSAARRSVSGRWGRPEHLFVSVIAANVGIDPKALIEWVTSGPVRPKQLFIDGKIDAFLGFPPEPQEVRARDRPDSRRQRARSPVFLL